MAEERAGESRLLRDVEAEMRCWRTAHPQATLRELEQALDQRLRTARAALLTEMAAATPASEHCPSCGTRMVHRGQHSRSLTTQGDETLALQRPYLTCPACGTGLFPLG